MLLPILYFNLPPFKVFISSPNDEERCEQHNGAKKESLIQIVTQLQFLQTVYKWVSIKKITFITEYSVSRRAYLRYSLWVMCLQSHGHSFSLTNVKPIWSDGVIFNHIPWMVSSLCHGSTSVQSIAIMAIQLIKNDNYAVQSCDGDY